MKRVLLFIWQLPQNILGLLVILFTGAFKTKDGRYWVTGKGGFGVSLGSFIIFGDMNGRYIPTEKSIQHEQGHQKQSLYLGPLYLIVVGIPSLLGNLWDRFFHGSWNYRAREKWYYSRYPENWADKLGNVIRNF
jgi:hypothetical protein